MARNLVKAVVDLDDRLSSKLARVAGASRRFRDDTDRNAKATKGWGREVEDAGLKVHKWFGEKSKSLVRGWFMSLKVSAAIGVAALSALAASALKDYMGLETTLRNTTGLLAGAGEKTPQQLEAAYANFKKDIYRLAPELGKAPQDLANSLYDIVSGGFEGAEATKVLEAATKGGAAGMADTATVANALVKTLAAYGLGATEAAGITDQMFQSVNLGIISFEEMAQQIGDVVGLASTAKVSFGDLMAAIAVMTRKGLVPAEAFTALNQTMLSILSPTPASMEAAAEVFGKNADDIWSARGLAKRGLAGTMEEVMKVMDPSPDQLKRLNSMNGEVADLAAAEIAGDKMDVLTSLFGNVRALRGALVLASDDGYTFADAQEDMAKSMGATDRVMAEQEKTMQRQTDRVKAMFDVMKLQIMDDIAPELAKKLDDVSAFFKDVTESEEYQNAEGVGKLQVMGGRVWENIVGWWERNKEAVSKKVSEGIEFISGVIVPKVAEWGAKIGAELVPAIWKGMMDTAPGRMAVAAVAASWANKLGLGIGKGLGGAPVGVGGAGAGGAGAGAGGAAATTGAGLIRGTLAKGLAIGAAVFMVNEARVTYNKVVKEVDKEADDLRTTAETATGEQLEAGAEAAAGGSNIQKFSMWAYGALPGRDTDADVVKQEQERNRHLATANTIRTYQENDLLPALERLWNNPSTELAKELLSEKDAKAYARPENQPMLRALQEGRNGEFQETIRQYAIDPRKLSDAQRESVEFLIANTTDTISNIEKTAENLYGMDLSQQQFSDALAVANPLLSGIGEKTQEWSLNLGAALTNLENGNKLLEVTDKAFWEKFFSGAWGPTTPQNPVGETGPRRYAPGSAGEALQDGIYGKDHKNDYTNELLEMFGIDRGPRKPRAMANGGHGTVSQPTLFMAGEAGAEDFAFTPHLKGGIANGSGGGVTVMGPLIGTATIAAEGQSIEEVADQLADILAAALVNGS